MTLDRIMALLAFTVFAVFLGIVAVKVARVDLAIVVLIGLGFATYDLWTQLRRRQRL